MPKRKNLGCYSFCDECKKLILHVTFFSIIWSFSVITIITEKDQIIDKTIALRIKLEIFLII